MTFRKFYRRYGDFLITVALIAAIGFVAYGCGHEDDAAPTSVIRKAGR